MRVDEGVVRADRGWWGLWGLLRWCVVPQLGVQEGNDSASHIARGPGFCSQVGGMSIPWLPIQDSA